MTENSHFHFCIAFSNEGYELVHSGLRMWKKEDDDQVSIVRFDAVLGEYTEALYQRGNIIATKWQCIAVRSITAHNPCDYKMNTWTFRTKHVLLVNISA